MIANELIHTKVKLPILHLKRNVFIDSLIHKMLLFILSHKYIFQMYWKNDLDREAD